MPFFFIVPLWALAATVGVVLLFVRQLRSTGIYVLVSSTGGLLLSFLLSTCVLILLPKLPDAPAVRWLLVIGYLGAIPVGGLAGIVLGFFVARLMVRKLAHAHSSDT
jgi:hypothetical protein